MTGFTGSAGMALITREEALFLTDFRYVEQAKAQAPDYTLVRYDDPYKTLHERLARYAGRRIGFESHHVTVEQLENLKNPPDGQPAAVEWVPVKGLVEELRGRKSQEELELDPGGRRRGGPGFFLHSRPSPAGRRRKRSPGSWKCSCGSKARRR